jgi:hypothetical protein
MSDETKCQVCSATSIGMVWGVHVCGECLGAWSRDCVMPANTADLPAMESAAKAFLRKRHVALKSKPPESP